MNQNLNNYEPHNQLPSESARQHAKTGKWMLMISWLCILGMGFLFFKWHEMSKSGAYNTVSTKNQYGVTEVKIPITDGNRYEVIGLINDTNVMFLIDTGATSLAIPESVAKKAGLQQGMPVTIMTAGGSQTGYLTNVPKLTIGNDPNAQIVIQNIPATINPGMSGDSILLGMGTLKQLELLQTKDTLILRQNP